MSYTPASTPAPPPFGLSPDSGYWTTTEQWSPEGTTTSDMWVPNDWKEDQSYASALGLPDDYFISGAGAGIQDKIFNARTQAGSAALLGPGPLRTAQGSIQNLDAPRWAGGLAP